MKTHIVLHHSAVTGEKPQFDGVFSYHNAGAGGKWPSGHGIQYAYFIEKDGIIVQGRGEDETTWHAGKWYMNTISIAICLAGNFTKEDPTRAQLKSLKDLLKDIQMKRGIKNENILLHRQVRSTQCPGTDLIQLIKEKFPDKTLEQRIRQIEKAIPKAGNRRKSLLRRLLGRLLGRK